MIIVSKEENSELFVKYWVEYQKGNDTGISYSLDLINYYLITNESILKSDKSFVIIDDKDTCLGICFLPIYSDNGNQYIDGFAPVAKNQQTLKKCFECIDVIANNSGLVKVSLSIDTCYFSNKNWAYNYLRSYDYLDCTSNGYIFELNDKPDELFKRFNSSSRKLIRKSLREGCEVTVYNSSNIAKDIFLNYKKYHIICAGRQTRSDESFDSMLKSIKSDNAILVEVSYQDKAIGYLHIPIFFPYAMMGSMANLPEYEKEFQIYRLLLWGAVQYLHNYKLMLNGFPAGHSKIDGLRSYMDEKQIGISRYKSFVGFELVPYFKGVKYFDKRVAEEELLEFKEKIVKCEWVK
jgi:hypothetical protein